MTNITTLKCHENVILLSHQLLEKSTLIALTTCLPNLLRLGKLMMKTVSEHCEYLKYPASLSHVLKRRFRWSASNLPYPMKRNSIISIKSQEIKNVAYFTFYLTCGRRVPLSVLRSIPVSGSTSNKLARFSSWKKLGFEL